MDTQPERNHIYFLSDTHLGAPAFEHPREVEQRVVRFLDSIAGDATELYLLGDILDYWYEYRTVVPRGFVRFFGALARLADSGVRITWMVGNHDVWLFDYLSSEIGLVVSDPSEGGMFLEIAGHRFFVAHGDGIARPRLFLRAARRIFRSRLCQRLYASVHPRWTVALARGCSGGSRKRGSRPDILARETVRTNESLLRWSREMAEADPALEYIVVGHYHRPQDIPLRPDGSCRLLVLGEWEHRPAYAVFDGHELRLKYFESEEA